MLKPQHITKDRTSQNYNKRKRKKPASATELYGPPAPPPVSAPYTSVMDDMHPVREGLKRLEAEREALVNRPMTNGDLEPSALTFC